MYTSILSEFALHLPWFCGQAEHSFANRIMGNRYIIENEARLQSPPYEKRFLTFFRKKKRFLTFFGKKKQQLH